jgi:hypothetical protein
MKRFINVKTNVCLSSAFGKYMKAWSIISLNLNTVGFQSNILLFLRMFNLRKGEGSAKKPWTVEYDRN